MSILFRRNKQKGKKKEKKKYVFTSLEIVS